MKLLFYDFEIPYFLGTTDFAVGGACVRQYAILKGLQANNFNNFAVLCEKGANKIASSNSEFELIESININLGYKRIRWLTHRIPILIKSIKKYKPDFLFQKSAGKLTGILAILAKLLGIKFVHIVTSDLVINGTNLRKDIGAFNYFLYQSGILITDIIICQNNEQYNFFKTKFSQKRIFLLKNPFFPNLTQQDLSLNRKYFCWIGNIRPVKNIKSLLEIAKSLPDFSFLIAGKIKDESTSQTCLLELFSLPNVKYLGYLEQDKISYLLSNAYGLINTSVFEGFSNTFLESFYVGTPVLSYSTDPDNIFSQKKLGFIINPDNLHSVIDYIVHDFDYKYFFSLSRKYLDENHNYINVTKNLINFLSKING